MPKRGQARVSVFKKVKLQGQWVLCPALPEANGRYNGRVQVGGRVEIHHEGSYYIQWREDGRRYREAVPSQTAVHERVQLKTLELNAASAGLELRSSEDMPLPSVFRIPASSVPPVRASSAIDPSAGTATTAQQVLQGLGLYLQQLAHGTAAASAPEIPPVSTRPAPASTGLTPFEEAASSISIAETSGPKVYLPSAGEPGNATKSNGTIAETIKAFLKDVEPPQREWKTYEEYRNVLCLFRDQSSKTYVKEIGRDDCLAFMRHLYSIGNEARTVFNRIGIVLHWLRLNGRINILEKGDKPKYVEHRREMYQREDLEALFRACTPEERIRYLFFLLTGERDKEVRYTAWPDIDFNRRCVWVTAKKELGFKPKDKEERKIPVPASLLQVLAEYKRTQRGPHPHNLVFPTSQGKPDKKFENKLKRIAHRAGLNCGRCVSKHGNKCSEGPHCGKWFLHKFRHTFATNQLEEGISIRRLQEWLGHSDIESTMVYLKYVESEDIYDIVDNTEIAGFVTYNLGSRPPETSRTGDEGRLPR